MTEGLDNLAQEPTVSRGVGLLTALVGIGLLLDLSLEELPLRSVMGSLLVLAAGRLLLRRKD